MNSTYIIWIAASEITTAFYKSHIVSTVHHTRTESEALTQDRTASVLVSHQIEYHGGVTKSVAGALETMVNEGMSSMNVREGDGILIL